MNDLQGPGPTSRVFFSQRLRLHYVDWGNSAAPPLVLVHGGRDHCRNWDWVAERLRSRLAHHRAGPARPRRQRVVAHDGTYMHDRLHLRPRPAHPSAPSSPRSRSSATRSAATSRCATRASIPRPSNASSPSRASGHRRRWRPSATASRSTSACANWIEEQRKLSGRLLAALRRRSRTPTRGCRRRTSTSPPSRRAISRSHGVNQNEDGTYSWKFDNYVRSWPPYDIPQSDIEALWARIACPTLLVYGKESWASNPRGDGRIAHFKTASVVQFERAGHWVHHDRLETFMDMIEPFTAGQPIPQNLEGVA